MIVVIGCSLVDTDFHLSGMLGHAIKERKRDRRPFDFAILVDKVGVRRKWEKLLKGNVDNRVPYRSFAHFIRGLKGTGGAIGQD
jgi:hypothetical protein